MIIVTLRCDQDSRHLWFGCSCVRWWLVRRCHNSCKLSRWCRVLTTVMEWVSCILVLYQVCWQDWWWRHWWAAEPDGARHRLRPVLEPRLHLVRAVT